MVQPHQIRIIGGRWRGRRVRFPAIADVRPTPDRVRETLFNWLRKDLTGLTTLDPYSGSGALSLEALSRGASLAVAVDREPRLVRALAATGDALGTSTLETHCADALAFLSRETRTFDVVFLDPPFALFASAHRATSSVKRDGKPADFSHGRGPGSPTTGSGWPRLLAAAVSRVAPGGAIYVEAPSTIDAPVGFVVARRDRAGQVHYHLLRHE